MSVNIAERPTSEKRAVHFDRGVFANVIYLVEGRILNLIVTVNGHCIL